MYTAAKPPDQQNVNNSMNATVDFVDCILHIYIYATLAYIRHFIFADCYDNNPCYLVTNLAGHLDFAGFYFSKCPANSKCPAKFVTRYQVQVRIYIL